MKTSRSLAHRRRATGQGRRYLALASAVATCVSLDPKPAAAYSTHTVVSDACHEDMTQVALERTREQLGDLDRVAATANERALIEDVPFELRDNLKDLGAATLVLGNRDIDFRGNEPQDLDRLAPLHGSPNRQHQHCLRNSGQDGSEGSREALDRCRGFIREKVEAALDGLDASGTVDPNARTEMRTPLDIRGAVDARLPTYHVEMGRALHTIQDGFSHTFRSEDHRQVVTVLNYVELVEDRLDRTDGPAHRSKLDACHGLDTLRQQRLEVARNASTEFLLATLNPALSRDQKLDEVNMLLNKYFSHSDGCDADNDWCNAPEAGYENSSPSCQLGAHGTAAPWWSAWFVGGLGLAWLRRRRHSIEQRAYWDARGGSGGRRSVAGASALLLSLAAGPARAQEVGESNSADPDPVDAPLESQVVAQEDARIEQDAAMPWGVALNLSGAITNPAAAAALGARYRIDENWLLGLDAEYNPWYAEHTSRFRPGVASAYASVIVRFPMRFERTNLRSTLQLGASRMLFDLYGVPKGTTGPYIGINLLGIDYELGRQLYLVVNPAHIALPVPQTSGAPFSYTQYRITLGLQFGA